MATTDPAGHVQIHAFKFPRRDYTVKTARHFLNRNKHRVTHLDETDPNYWVFHTGHKGKHHSERHLSGGIMAVEIVPSSKASKPRKPSSSPKSKAKYRTRYQGPTDTTGSRIIVTILSTGKSKAVPYDYAAVDAHESALREVTGSKAALRRVDDGDSGYYWHGATARKMTTGKKKAAKKTARKKTARKKTTRKKTTRKKTPTKKKAPKKTTRKKLGAVASKSIVEGKHKPVRRVLKKKYSGKVKKKTTAKKSAKRKGA